MRKARRYEVTEFLTDLMLTVAHQVTVSFFYLSVSCTTTTCYGKDQMKCTLLPLGVVTFLCSVPNTCYLMSHLPKPSFTPCHPFLSFFLNHMLYIFSWFFGLHVIYFISCLALSAFFRLGAAFSMHLLFFSTRKKNVWSRAITTHLGGPQGTAVAFSHEYYTTQQINVNKVKRV